jgi:hypothetical protein
MYDAGSAMGRIFGGIKGALGNLQHLNQTGPKALNGGEVIISAGRCSFRSQGDCANGCVDGECEYIYRMQNTVDHTNISELAELVGAKYVAPAEGAHKQQTCDAGAK